MLIGHHSAVPTSYSLSGDGHIGGETLMILTETCTVTAVARRCDRSASMLLYHCYGRVKLERIKKMTGFKA